MSYVEAEVVGVRIELPANQPVLLLKVMKTPRYLPIWIGAVEANAISIALRGLTAPRPLSHGLMLDILGAYGAELKEVRITGTEGHIFLAELRTSDGKTISARPSDAVAMALTASASIYIDEQILDANGIEAPEADEEEVAQFREFLDHVSAEDFENGN